MKTLGTLLLFVMAAGSLRAQGKPTVDELSKKLGDADHKERLKAAKALGAMGTEGKAAALALGRCAWIDFSPEVQKAAGEAFAKVRPDLAASVATLNTSNDDRAMTDAAEKIGKLGRDGVAASPALMRCITRHDRKGKSDSSVVAVCIRAIGEVVPSDKDYVGQLGQSATLNASAEIREAAVTTLGKIGVAHPEMRKPVLPYLRIAMQSTSADVRVAAVRAAGSLGPDARPLLAAVRQAAKDDDAKVREAAAAALAAIEKKDK